MEAIRGRASDAGTARLRKRLPPARADAFRRLDGRWVSPIGLGTYLGDPDEATDALYAEALGRALDDGLNLIDTAANYRCQRSERAIGLVAAALIKAGRLSRDELLLCTKGGYLPFDADMPADPARYIIDTFFAPGILAPEELVSGCHAISPGYLAHQLDASLRNLGVETIDLYYLHNPEQQLEAVPREEFLGRMERAFQLLETRAADGAIGGYGLATWNGFRVPAEAPGYLSLETLVGLAERVGGPGHHLRAVQAPLNLAMPELHTFRNQQVGGAWMSLLDAARRLGIAVIASASLLQGRLASLPEGVRALIPGLATDAQRAVQFTRSVPGLTAALVGMKRASHVEEIARVLDHPGLEQEAIGRLFARHGHR